MNSDDAGFKNAVDRWVTDALRADDIASLDDLVCQLPGVYPTEVRKAVDRLKASGALTAVVAHRLLRRSPTIVPVPTPAWHLPVPHPLDYDWRFGSSSLEHLGTQCERLSGSERIILLGAPTLLWALREQGRVSALLLDADSAVVAAFDPDPHYEARRCDFRRDPLPDLSAQVIVLDPPWYSEHECLFLWAASRLARPGTTVLMSMPGEGTRAGVADEAKTALQAASRWGFEVSWREPGALPYLSPPFERNALLAAGLGGMPNEWRRGDLVALRAVRADGHEDPTQISGDRWSEVVIGRVRGGCPGLRRT